MRRLFAAIMQRMGMIGNHAVGTRYFVIFFGAENGAITPQLTHSFAVFLKAEYQSSSPVYRPHRVSSFCISWLPATGEVRLLSGPEPGRNLSYEETLNWTSERDLKTKSWGPYEITQQCYADAEKQFSNLSNGRIAYKAIDNRFRPAIASNCIHAIADAIPGPLLRTWTACGYAATELVQAHYRPVMIDADRVHSWVLGYLDPN